MNFSKFERVVLTKDIPEEALKAGDLGVIVEHYPPGDGVPEGVELEFFSGNGKTIALVSVAVTGIRKATEGEILSVRELAST